MFNLQSEVNRLQQLKHDKVHGLPYKRKLKNPKDAKRTSFAVQHVDGTIYNGDAEQEGIAISNGFKNKSRDFGRRLSKAKGQKHHPGGGCHIGEYKNV